MQFKRGTKQFNQPKRIYNYVVKTTLWSAHPFLFPQPEVSLNCTKLNKYISQYTEKITHGLNLMTFFKARFFIISKESCIIVLALGHDFMTADGGS